MRTIDIKKNDANQRLDKFLSKRFKTMPKSLMYKYIRTKYIKLNGKKCDIKDMLKEGDVLTLYIKDEFLEESEQENYEFLKLINEKFNFFNKIIPLVHPRFIMQYNSKNKDYYLRKYLTAANGIPI